MQKPTKLRVDTSKRPWYQCYTLSPTPRKIASGHLRFIVTQ